MVSSASTQGTVLITGAARRIGRALAIDFAGKGWQVAVHYNKSGEDAAALVELIERENGSAFALEADLRKPDAAEKLINQTADKVGAVTCLINNASLFEPDDIYSITPESWSAHIDTNLRSPVFLAQHFARRLPSGAQGNIINMLDQRVWNLTPDLLSYTTSKAALLTLTQTLAQALSPAIRVNAIGPGPTLPNKRQSEDDFHREIETTLLKRPVSLDEICACAHFILASPALTGQMIALDGGQHLGKMALDDSKS